MDLVAEYLRAVAALLPKAQREDIIAELRDTILTRLEEREGELGRPLADDEVEAVLREVGHPVVIAARYREGPQHVVGPTLYPYWLFAVRAAIALQVVVAAVVVVIKTLAFGNVSMAIGQAIGSGVTGLLVMIGAATVAAWFIERRGARIDYLDNWRVRDLRFLEVAAWDLDTLRDWIGARHAQHARDQRPHPQRPHGPTPPRPPHPPHMPPTWHPSWHPAMQPIARGLCYIALGTVLVLWWTGVVPLGFGLDTALEWPSLGLSPGGLAAVDWSAMRAMLFWPVVAYGVVVILQGAMALAYPFAVRLQGLLDAARGLVLLGFCVWVWTLSPLAKAIAVASPADFIRQMSMFSETPPLPLEPIATIVVLCVGFSACILVVRGLLNLAFGRPPAYLQAAPPPGMSHTAN